MKRLIVVIALLSLSHSILAEELKPLTNVPYGSHARQVLDFYPAKSDKPTPVVFYIHGGGWRGGDKENESASLQRQRHLRRRDQLPVCSEWRGGKG